MNAIDTQRTKLTCPTCGIWEAASTQHELAFKYFAVQRKVEGSKMGPIKMAICRTCGSAAIIEENQSY